MKLLKNLEAAFLITATLAVSASFVSASADSVAAAPQAAAIAGTANMQVVVVSAKRMTAAEKLQSLQAEQALASARTARRT